jgi:hypothetical protein
VDPCGVLKDGSGEIVLTFDGGPYPGYFNVEVPPGQPGKAWLFWYCGGTPFLMTVPSFIARSPEELLVPREVLEAELRGR